MKYNLPIVAVHSARRPGQEAREWLVDGFLVLDLQSTPEAILRLVRGRSLYWGLPYVEGAADRFDALEEIMAAKGDICKFVKRVCGVNGAVIKKILRGSWSESDLEALNDVLDAFVRSKNDKKLAH